MRLFIIGFKSSGKTTLGKELARRLNLEFIDLDDYIEAMERRHVTEIYSTLGEDEFRKIEWKALKQVIKKDNLVVSTGGGAPCHCDNMRVMQENGKTVYLNLDDETLVSRLKLATKDRPIVKGKSEDELKNYMVNLRRNCEHYYLQANYVVEGPDITVEKIISKLNIDL